MASKYNESRQVVEAVVRKIGFQDQRALRVELRRAYPYYKRVGWAYRCWLRAVHDVTYSRGFRLRRVADKSGNLDMFPEHL